MTSAIQVSGLPARDLRGGQGPCGSETSGARSARHQSLTGAINLHPRPKTHRAGAPLPVQHQHPRLCMVPGFAAGLSSCTRGGCCMLGPADVGPGLQGG